jgi:methyl-accepting chemotaxis protein
MIGVNIDSFHKNPKHQADLLARFTNTYVANLEISDRFMRVSASPVINDKGERLGAVAEWLDRTDEVRIEKEVAGMVDGALRGNFETRLALEGKEGFVRQLSEGLNQLSEVTQSGLTDVAQILQRVASGDLTQKIDADYQGIFGQLKDDTNTTIERLREVVGRIKDATEAINIASQEIAAGNADLSSRTEEQASSLEETSSAMEELNATVRQNAENARQANDLAKTSNAGVVKGGQVVKQVVVTMGEIQASSKKISDIIGVIDSIAFQTNILALNAAVEAARAGEQGRGFAVVASEVRNLAQRSATAAKEIKTLIAESVDKVESGAKLVQEAGTTMDEVVASFQQVAGLVTEIASASKEQSFGHRADHPGGGPDGRGDAAECGAGGRSRGGRREPGRAGPRSGADGVDVQAGRGIVFPFDPAGAGAARCDAASVAAGPAPLRRPPRPPAARPLLPISPIPPNSGKSSDHFHP